MTDRMAALTALSLRDVPERAAALDDFYERYPGQRADRRQVAVAAGRRSRSRRRSTRVKALTSHPAFSMSNPNRVRALFGAFAMSNQTQLNRADGAGYDLLTDTVLALDPEESAGRRAPSLRAQELARARTGRRAHAQKRVAQGRRAAVAVARRERHRFARAR